MTNRETHIPEQIQNGFAERGGAFGIAAALIEEKDVYIGVRS